MIQRLISAWTWMTLPVCLVVCAGCRADPAPHKGISAVAQECGACHAPAAATADPVIGPWLEPAVRLPGPIAAMFRRDAGDLVTWEDLGGQPFVFTGIYTRCTNPTRCARMARSLAAIATAIQARPGLKSACYLATFNPAYDDNARIASFAALQGLGIPIQATSLVPDAMSLELLADALSLRVQWDRGEVSAHASQVYMCDRQGRVARIYTSSQPPIEDVITDLARLAEEPEK